MYQIGEFSKLTKLTIKTLRYYDAVGLLTPDYVDQENGYRYYSTKQMIEVQWLIALRQIGLSIEEIKQVKFGNQLQEILLTKKTATEEYIAQSKLQLSMINHILSFKENFMKYQAIVKELPACTIFYREGVIEDFTKISHFIMSAEKELKVLNPKMKYAKPDYCFTSYLDGEYKPRDIHLMYAQAVEKMGEANDDIKFKTLPSVKAICILHRGSYQLLGEAYAAIFQYIEENGYTPVELAREHYIDGIWNHKKEADWLTEIQVPVI